MFASKRRIEELHNQLTRMAGIVSDHLERETRTLIRLNDAESRIKELEEALNQPPVDKNN
jgi:hypothetical protein